MRYMSQINHRSNSGFTLVEVVVIAPILILTLGGFIMALVVMVGDTLASRDTNALVYDTQVAMDRIEQDVRLSVGFLSTTGTLPSPQGTDGADNYNSTGAISASASDHLILSTLSTTSNPLAGERQVVYYGGPGQPYPCGANQSYNTPHKTTVIYFRQGNDLYRRTIVPSYTTTAGQSNTICATTVWQQNSCTPGYTNTTLCKTQDSKIMDNVTSLALAYHGSPSATDNITASNAAAATTVSITINTGKTTAGQPISNTATLRASRLNTSQ